MASRLENVRKLPSPKLIVAVIAAIVLVVVVGRFCSSASTIEVNINGSPLTLHGAKTMGTAIRESGLPVNPGDLISLNGTVLKKSEGYPFAATVNGNPVVDSAYQLHAGDVITVTDGEDKLEDYDAVPEPLPHGGDFKGLGSICRFTPGVDGVIETRTGRISGETVQKVTTPATDTECKSYNPDVGDDKVIALTFDDGPTDEYTTDILEALRENDAKATFFCLGSRVASNPDLVKRAREEGHQVCPSAYDLSWMGILSGDDGGATVDANGLRDELERSRQALSDALDGEELSRCVRLPVADLTDEMVAAVEPYVDADISWSVDTGDWVEYNAEQVYRVLVDVEPGDVILMHDGGGDRSATLRGLTRALPELKRKGFSFVTIDELMRYPEPSS